MKAYILPYGQLNLPRSAMYGEGEGDDIVKFPSYGVLVENEDSLVLFDTGCSMDPSRPDIIPDMCEYSPEDTIPSRLASVGFQPSDVKYVVFSHMHVDHAGDMQLFGNATFVAGKDEKEKMTTIYDPPMPEGVLDIFRTPEFNWKLIGLGETELVPGVKLHNLGPGHSYNMIAMELSFERPILVVGDLVYHSWAYEGKPAGFAADPEGYASSVSKVHELADRLDADIWFGHDPDQFPRLKKAPEYYC